VTRSVRVVLGAQAFYYVVTGVWPFVSMRSFEWVTGPKTDHWLVYTVGLLLAVIGAGIATAIRLGETGAAIAVVAIGAALALAAIEVVHVSMHVIGTIYLLDAAVEIALAFALAWTLVRSRATT
jgi:hypothetical protein